MIRAYNSDGAMTLDEYRKLRGIEPPEAEKDTEEETASATD